MNEVSANRKVCHWPNETRKVKRPPLGPFSFAPLDRLGPHALRAFTGHYHLLGSPIHSEGDLFIDSVHSFKGQSALCIVLTEIDFEELDPASQGSFLWG